MAVFRTNRGKVAPGDTPFDPHGGRLWNPPGVVDAINVRVPAGEGLAPILGAVGDWANYEVWCDVPNAWRETEFVLSLKTGDLITEIDRIAPFQIEHLTATPGSSAGIFGQAATGRIRGLLFQSLGRPGNGELEVRAVRRSAQDQGGGDLQGGNFWIRAWGTEGQSQGDRVGRPVFDRWARRHQNLRSIQQTEAAGTVALFGGVPADNRAIHITDLLITSDNFAPVIHRLELFNAAVPLTIEVARFTVSQFNAIQLDLAMPFTGLRGYSWQLVRLAGAGIITSTFNGYLA